MRNNVLIKKMLRWIVLPLFFIPLFGLQAQENKAELDMTELAKQTQNPVANMYQFPFSYLGDFNSGTTKSYISTLMVKPVVPVKLSKSLLFIFRAVIPVTFMPSPINKTGLSDIQLQLYIDGFINYNFKHGWALGYTPEIYVNWNQGGTNWNLPVGLNISKVFKIGKQPFSANVG